MTVARGTGRGDDAFEVGRAYTRDQIHARVGGSKRACLPMKDGVVVAACLLASFNPEAPLVVLCGAGPGNGPMGEALARQRTPLPMFLKAGVGQWVYEGSYVPTGSSTAGPRFERHLARSTRALERVARRDAATGVSRFSARRSSSG